MNNVEDILHIYNKLVNDRAQWDSHWEEIASYVLPRQRNITNLTVSKGDKRTERIFDSSPQVALERFAAIMDSMLTPRQQKWHGLRSTDENVNEDPDVKRWFFETTLRMFSYRYSPTANFAGQNFERWVSVGAFGTGAIYTDFDLRLGLRYRVVHLKNLYFLENHQGIIDGVFRRFVFTLRQAIQQWGLENLPEQMQKYAQDPRRLLTEFPFLHVVIPRDDHDPERMDHKAKAIASYYICLTTKQLISEGGYYSFPYSISRYVTAPDEVYGRSPAMSALPDIKMINEMSKTDIRAVHKLVDPPLLLSDDGVLTAGTGSVDLRPGGINMGGVDSQGKPLILPLQTGARVDINEVKMEQRRRRIDDAFLITLFQILVENPRMTATEALIRAQEKGTLIAPMMGRQQSEALGPQIQRELDLLMQHGMLDPLPEALSESRDFEIVYESPANRLQRSEELVGVQRSMEILSPFATLKPQILDIFDDEELARLTAEVSGVPPIVLKTREQVAAERQKQEEEMQLQQLGEVAPPLASALKDAAQAQSLTSGG